MQLLTMQGTTTNVSLPVLQVEVSYTVGNPIYLFCGNLGALEILSLCIKFGLPQKESTDG